MFLFHLYRNIHIWTHACRQGTARTGSWGWIGTKHGPKPTLLLSPCNMVFAAWDGSARHCGSPFSKGQTDQPPPPPPKKNYQKIKKKITFPKNSLLLSAGILFPTQGRGGSQRRCKTKGLPISSPPQKRGCRRTWPLSPPASSSLVQGKSTRQGWRKCNT